MNEIPEDIAKALAENLEAMDRNEEVAMAVLQRLDDDQRLKVIWFMEQMGAIHDVFYLLRLSAAESYARGMPGEGRGVACVIDDHVLEVTARFRERRADDPDPGDYGHGKPARA